LGKEQRGAQVESTILSTGGRGGGGGGIERIENRSGDLRNRRMKQTVVLPVCANSPTNSKMAGADKAVSPTGCINVCGESA
jgi:hypothetical protein